MKRKYEDNKRGERSLEVEANPDYFARSSCPGPKEQKQSREKSGDDNQNESHCRRDYPTVVED